MPKNVFIMRAPQPVPEWEWSRWLRATETELGPTPLLLLVRERFDAMESLLRRALAGIHATATERFVALEVMDVADEIEDLLAEIDAAKAGG